MKIPLKFDDILKTSIELEKPIIEDALKKLVVLEKVLEESLADN